VRVTKVSSRSNRKPPGGIQLAAAVAQLELVRPPAPGHLEVVRNLINTLDVDKGTDLLESSEQLAAWLRENGLAERKAPKPTEEDLERVHAVRAELHALAARNNSIQQACSTEVLDEASRRSAYALTFDPATNSSVLRPTATGVDGALGRILAAVHAAMADRTWPRLKACADETCRWAYFDHSKNGCSRWCGDNCGNRSKVKRYRERQAQAGQTR